MAVRSIQLHNRNQLVEDYLAGKLTQFFHYDAFRSTEERIKDLQSRSFQRDALADSLEQMNRSWGASEQSLQNIERLRQDESLVVIGGQQAGVLTGPLLTIHKVISIIQYAKAQESSLKRPVIPVFWIAGEDHDYAEINHIYTMQKQKMQKQSLPQKSWKKLPISHLELDKQVVETWLRQLFYDMKETPHTRQLAEDVFKQLDMSNSFVDFFARLIHQVFKDEGLVLFDSGHEAARRLESKYFERMIQAQEGMTGAIHRRAKQLQQLGYPIQVDLSAHDGNLFLLDSNGERVLLMNQEDHWFGKQDEVSLSTNDLLKIAREEPERLSNNVLTRPIMQEALFPTLAFIAGDAEISYWALLRDAFTAFDKDFVMPPIMPRLSITFVTERIDKLLGQEELDLEAIINKGCQRLKVNWLAAQENPPIEDLFELVKEEISSVYSPIQAAAARISKDLQSISEQNLKNLLKEIDFMKKRTLQGLHDRYRIGLEKFEEIELVLRPNGVLQERVWNILPFLNEYGPTIIKELLTCDLSFEDPHYVIFLHRLSQSEKVIHS